MFRRVTPATEIDAIVAAAMERWPSLVGRAEALRAHVEALALAEGGAEGMLPHAGDIGLAFGAASGDRALVGAYVELADPVVRSAVARVRASDDVRAEVSALLSERMLVGGGGRPRLLDYRGRAPLAAWVRVAAVRATLDLRKKKEPELAPTSRSSPDLVAEGDPELLHMQEKYGEAFRAAFAEAFAELGDGDRAVLRMTVVEGLGIDGVAGVLGVHRATAARWAAQARETLAARTQEIVAARLGLDPSELASVARMCDSVIDLSIVRVLG